MWIYSFQITNGILSFKGDITRPGHMYGMRVQGVDYVLHQAAWGSVPRSIEMPLLLRGSQYTAGTLNMMEAAG